MDIEVASPCVETPETAAVRAQQDQRRASLAQVLRDCNMSQPSPVAPPGDPLTPICGAFFDRQGGSRGGLFVRRLLGRPSGERPTGDLRPAGGDNLGTGLLDDQSLMPCDQPLMPFDQLLTPFDQPLVTFDPPLMPFDQPLIPFDQPHMPFDQPLMPCDVVDSPWQFLNTLTELLDEPLMPCDVDLAPPVQVRSPAIFQPIPLLDPLLETAFKPAPFKPAPFKPRKKKQPTRASNRNLKRSRPA